MSSLWKLVGDVIPDDHSRQVSAYDLARHEMERPDAPATVLDLGCGDAASARVFRGVRPDVRWVGLDIAENAAARAVTSEEVVLYDGVTFPMATGSIPLIYSRQVFEHVRYPERVLAEIARVLTPGGIFIGSTSHLEPYHEYSLWNYTPYGFRVLVEAAGLELLEIRPGPDGPALITRAFEGRLPEHGGWFTGESPLNAEIDAWGRETGRRPALVNLRKLEFCGHFGFRVRKPSDWRPSVPQRESWWQRLLGARLERRVREAVKRIPGARPAVAAVRRRTAGHVHGSRHP